MKKLSTHTLLKRVAFALPVTLVGLFASANAYGSVILDGVLANASFENGNQASGCPNSWTCSGSPSPGFTSYLVTSAQYTAGSDGLGGGQIVPDGTHASYSPTLVEGSGDLQQTLAIQYLANTVYTVDLWVGTPKTEIDGTTAVKAPVGTITAYFLGAGGVTLGGTNNDTKSITAPTMGQWQLFTLNFDTTGTTAAGKFIEFDIHVDSQNPAGSGNGNDHIVNFDIASVPEPASFALMGLGLLGLGVVRKKLRR